MAGAGGGPSRRSHTKSRKGCKTCKRRHIRCDESFPQCRNCTKHQVRCDYMDNPTAARGDEASPTQQANLLWTPEIERAVDLWQQSGEFPFPDLGIFPQPQWSGLGKTELRLIYHVAQICSEANRNRTSKVIIWTELMPKFLSVAAAHTFVMHAVLAFSANHLAWVSQSDETRNIAMNHRAVALRGLHETIGTFSQSNADAFLSGSLLLAWQATEWRNWASLMTGISSITQAMQSWRDRSIFHDYLLEHASDPVQVYTEASSLQTTPERRQEQLVALQSLHTALEQLQLNLPSEEQGHVWIEQLKSYVRRLQTSSAPQTPEEQFTQLYALRKWLFWVPVSLLSSQNNDSLTLLVLAYFYTAAIAVEPIFPDVGADFTASIALNALTEIARIITQFRSSQGYSASGQQAGALMSFPGEIASRYRTKTEWARQSMVIPTVQQMPFGLEALNIDLNAQISDQGYYPNLSPAFAPSPLNLGSSTILSQTGAAPRSPYLEVPRTPHSTLDVTASHNYLSGSSLYSTPLSTPMASPAATQQTFGNLATAQEEQAFFGSGAGTWHGGTPSHLQQHHRHQQHPSSYQQHPMPMATVRSNFEDDVGKGKGPAMGAWLPPNTTM